MRLDEYMDLAAESERAKRRRLAQEKSYDILDHLEDFQHRFEETVQGDSLFGSVSPSIFVGASNYPNVSTGILSPVGREDDAAKYETSAGWYEEGVSIEDVFRRRTSLLNSNRPTEVQNVNDAWDGFLGVQREVAIADRPVSVEIGLDGRPDVDFDVGRDDIATPTGPRARARSADLAENPHVPRPVQKTLEDDDWNAQGAMNYLYRRGFDVYDINTILSAGALGQGENRRLVPTRWSITAVDDTVGQFLRGRIQTNPSVDTVEIHRNEFLGNAFWVILAPGDWEFELVEMKAPGSVWNPDPEAGMWLAADGEGFEGRTGYVEETAGAYHASRLGALEHLDRRDRQAKVLVLRHVSDDYWGPAGVWQVRESVRDAFEGESATAETFAAAVRQVTEYLPVTAGDLRRKSTMASGLQTNLGDFS
ncbi:Nre family DNA repair protein [Halogeometricum sp. S1BR25-6]|uniref:DNA repair protein n=1 Tax=Halogeometricum salsisoli TaxID=2950536 RepID=A0ABU2GBZ8_9EURY|nr:DNA repair protein NreA [Halogeometricum sp. S1BR25-6]MDS0297981.1 Nre family DNA repair protein [Halogeometricum sp. S1BR25-6]